MKVGDWIIVVLISALLMSCGQKGDPTLTTFVKPSPVGNITAVHRENSLQLSWDYSDTQELIKGFYLEKSEVAGGNDRPGEFKKIAFLPDSARHYADTEFVVGRTYFYRITVVSLRKILSNLSPVLKVVPAVPPAPPSGLSYELTNEAVIIKWNEVSVKVKYNIYKSHDKKVFPDSPLNNLELDRPVYSDKVETGLPSYYAVRSVLNTPIKDEGPLSEALEVNPETFVPSRPSGLKYVYAPKGIVLIWNENPETWVKRYRVYRKRAGESVFSFIGEVVTPTFRDNDPLTSKTEYYITALGPSRESGPLEPVEVSPEVQR